MKFLKTSLALAAALLAFGSPALAAAPQHMVLGSAGEVFQLHLGYRSEIFPASSAEDTFLLALQVSHQDGTSEWTVVPETDIGEDVESTAALIYEQASRTLFLVWDSRVNYLPSVLKVASFDGEAWSEPITVRGGWLTPRSRPHIAVTRDKYDIEVEGESSVIHRTILHLAWWEASDQGDSVLYTPIILEDGIYVGDHSVISMAEFEGDGELGLREALSEDLLQTLTIRNGRDSDTVLVGFTDSRTAQVRTVEVRPTPGALSSVAGGLRSRVVELGSMVDLRGDLPSLAAEIRQEVVALAIRARLNPGVRSYLAGQVYQLVLGSDPDALDPISLADEARTLVVELGNSLLSNRLVNVSDPLRARLVELGSRTGSGGPSHIFAARVLSSRPAPATPAAPTYFFLSADGREVLVAWQGEERLHYLESLAEGWSEEASLLFGPDGLDLESAFDILRQRAEDR